MMINEKDMESSSVPNPSTDSIEKNKPDLAGPDIVGFEDLGLSEDALRTIRDAGYLVPTPIQEKAIPIIIEGRDVIGSAQTGTGKTATFTIPIVERLAGRGGTLAVVLAPTREIAQQTFDAFETFGKPRGVRACVLIGGVDMKPQLEALKTYPQVIVATPGRLFDHMERGSVWLEYVEVIVLDEADRMLDMGFLPQINRVMNEIPANTRQTLLFSATIPPALEKLCRTMMHEPVRVAVGKPLATASTIDQELWLCDSGKKMSALRKILRQESGTVIVFSRSKKGAVELWQSLHSAEFYDVTMLHSDRTQEQRLQALADFKAGKYRILIATDVAARGIDVANVSLVINFDVPLVPEDYVHRIGRSGRAGARGRSVTLYTYQDKRLLHDIEKMLGKPIPITNDLTGGGHTTVRTTNAHPESTASADLPKDGEKKRRHRGRRGRGGAGSGSGSSKVAGTSSGVPPVVPRSVAPQAEAIGGSGNSNKADAGAVAGEGENPKRRRRRRGGRGRRRRQDGTGGASGATEPGKKNGGGEGGDSIG